METKTEISSTEKDVGLSSKLFCFLRHKRKPYNEYTVAYKHGLLPHRLGDVIYECEKCGYRFTKGFTYIKRDKHNWQFSIGEGGDLAFPNIFMSFKYWVIPSGFYLYIPINHRVSWFSKKSK